MIWKRVDVRAWMWGANHENYMRGSIAAALLYCTILTMDGQGLDEGQRVVRWEGRIKIDLCIDSRCKSSQEST